MKKILSLSLLCVSVLIFVFSIGRTLAYWVVEGKTDNLITTGYLTAQIVEEYKQNQIVYPGDVIEKVVNVSNTGDVDSIIRVKITKAWGQVRENGQLIVDSTLSTNNILIDYNTNAWIYDDTDGYFYYKGVLKPGETTTEPLFTEFQITSSTDNDFSNMHADIKIEMESIQAAYGAVSVWGKTLENLGISYVSKQVIPNGIPAIIFVNPDKKFTFVSDGSEDNDIFCAWEQLIPGESRSQNISLENAYTEKVPISIRAEYNDTASSPSEQALIDDLLKKYVTITITDEFGNSVYNGAIWGNLDAQSGETMKNYISLGSFAAKEKKNYTVTIHVSPELDERYSNLMGKITWVFKAIGDSDSAYPAPQTGDTSNLPVLIVLMAVSGCTIVFLTVKRRKDVS